MANRGRVDIREESRNYNKLKKMLKEMKQNEVYVGITDDTTEREEQQTKELPSNVSWFSDSYSSSPFPKK